MKNKILFLGSLCLVLALGFAFVGCNAQVVEFATLGSPGEVKAVQTGSSVAVTWKAVEGASGYRVVYQQVGKTTYDDFGYGANYIASDMDSWAATVSLTPNDTDLAANTKVKIGVIAVPIRNDLNYSNPAWADGEFTVQ